jgi:hypothetical protein
LLHGGISSSDQLCFCRSKPNAPFLVIALNRLVDPIAAPAGNDADNDKENNKDYARRSGD